MMSSGMMRDLAINRGELIETAVELRPWRGP
jgi:hypothetical protein